MNSPGLAGFLYVGGGAIVIRFARLAYRRPDDYLARWFTGYIVPPIKWTRTRLRAFAVVWIFCAVLMASAGLSAASGPLRFPILLWVPACAIITLLLIPRDA